MLIVSIVIPTHNRKILLKRTLQELFSQISMIDSLSINVVVVDDGSIDGTDKMISSNFPKVFVIKGDGTWWYTKSVNEGFKYSIQKLNSDFVIALNDDIIIRESFLLNFLRPIIKKKIKKELHCALTIVPGVHPEYFFSGTKKEYWYGKTINNFPIFSQYKKEHSKGIIKTTRVTGRGLLIPKDALLELNYFDELFIQYKSDTDFGLRALAKGYNCFVNLDAIIEMELYETAQDASYLNMSLCNFIKSFTNPYSRNYLPSMLRFQIRHKGIIKGVFVFFLEILVKFKHHFSISKK